MIRCLLQVLLGLHPSVHLTLNLQDPDGNVRLNKQFMGASRIANRMANAVNPLLRLEAKMEGNGFVPLSPEEVWAGTFDGPITFNKTNAPCVVTKGCLAWMDEDAARQINVKSMTYAEHAVHEIFHILDLKVLGGVPSQALRAVQASDPTFPRRPGGLTQDTDQSFGFGSGVIGPYQKVILPIQQKK